MKADEEPLPPPTANMTRWIMMAVLVWGLLLALGTYLAGNNHPGWRAVIVAGCTLGFLGLWLVALALRQRRIEN